MLVISKRNSSVAIIFVSVILLTYVEKIVAPESDNPQTPESATNSEAVEGSAPTGERHIQIADNGPGRLDKSPTFKRKSRVEKGWEARKIFGKDGINDLKGRTAEKVNELKQRKAEEGVEGAH